MQQVESWNGSVHFFGCKKQTGETDIAELDSQLNIIVSHVLFLYHGSHFQMITHEYFTRLVHPKIFFVENRWKLLWNQARN